MARTPQKPSRNKPLTRLPGAGELDDVPVGAKPATNLPPAASGRRDPRRFVYAALDLGFAALYAGVFTLLAPTRHAAGQILLWSIVVALVVAAAGSILGRPRGFMIAAVGCAALLVLEVVLLVTIVMSAAYLSGVFGAFGRGAASISLAVGFLSLQLVLLPAFQLKYLMTRAGHRAFGRAPRAA